MSLTQNATVQALQSLSVEFPDFIVDRSLLASREAVLSRFLRSRAFLILSTAYASSKLCKQAGPHG